MKTKNKVPEPVALILLISLDSSLITIIGLEILAPADPPFPTTTNFSINSRYWKGRVHAASNPTHKPQYLITNIYVVQKYLFAAFKINFLNVL